MRYFFVLAIIGFSLGVYPPAFSQTPEQERSQQEDNSQSSDKPKQDEKSDDDLDAFFKEAEEQAEDGSSCHAPVEPIA